MAIEEVTALGRLLVQLLSLIRELGNDYFRADAAWREYPQRVAALEDIQKDLEKNLEKCGINEENSASFLQVVKGAHILLQREIDTLTKRKRKGRSGTWYPIRGTFFAASVKSSIETAEQAYKRISDNLTTRRLNQEGVEALAQDLGPWLRFSEDSRCVPLPDLEKRIISALYGVDGGVEQSGDCPAEVQHPRVVLLWGASGYGKSTVASRVALECQRNCSKFTKVVMLVCGPGLSIAVKKIELLKLFGGGDIQSESQDVDSKLKVHLRNPKTLIVLDDLLDLQLLLDFYNLSTLGPGPGAQYLITSQRRDVFQCLRPTYISIGDLEPGDAKKVLASHAGYGDHIIPNRFEKYADEMICQVGICPLVMTTLGAKIQRLGRNECESWSLASQNVFQHSKDENTPLLMHGVIYPKRFVPEMQSLFGALREEQKELLVLAGMWRGLSISEYALRYLYRAKVSHGSCNTSFRELVTELKDASLLSEGEEGFLLLHASRKSFILEYCKDRVESLRKRLEYRRKDGDAGRCTIQADNDMQDAVTDAVVCLHIDACFIKNAASQSNCPSYSSMGEETWWATIDITRTTIEPIMQLLVPDANPDIKWTEELSICIHQVLLEYVNNDGLHQDGIGELLTCKSSILPVFELVRSFCLMEAEFFRERVHFSLCRAFLSS